MLRNMLGSDIDLWKWLILDIFGIFLSVPAESRSLWQNETEEKNNTKLGPDIHLEKGNFWTKYWLYSLADLKASIGAKCVFKLCLS